MQKQSVLIKYLIIEKDIQTIDKISLILNEFIDFKCIGTTENYDSSMNMIFKESPCLVFLNVDNVIENPFQFIHELNQFQECIPEFIAISTSKKLAYHAIKNNFFDFFLSPLSDLDMRKFALKFQKKRKSIKLNTICLKSYKDYQYLNTDEILFLKADNNTTDFHMINDKTISAFKTLKTYEELLPKNFLRIHKSYIVNSNYVSRINYGKLKCFMTKHNNQIPFTKTYIDRVKNMNDILNQSTFLSLN